MSRHVVFGTGQVGRLVVEQLVAQGIDVVAVNRNGRADLPGAEVVGGDATDPAFTTRVAAGADAVYFCLNATNYARWAEEFPPLQRGVLAGAEAAGARLVVLDNLYAYGPTHGRDLVETLPGPADVGQGRDPGGDDRRAPATRTTPAGSRSPSAGPRTTSARAPPARRSARPSSPRALTGRTAQVMGDPDQPHSYSYTPDVAAGADHAGDPARRNRIGLAPAGRRDPHHPPDHRPRLPASPATGPASSPPARTTLRLFGLVKPAMREYLHTLYQFTDRWVVDDTKFRAAFGDLTTPLDDALATTLEWYRDAADASPLTQPSRRRTMP